MSENIFHDFKTFGWCIIPQVIPHPDRIAASVLQEIKQVFFQLPDEITAVKALTDKGKDPLVLLTDSKLREKYLEDPKSIWYNGNIRTPKIAKSSGITNIYHNQMVRDNVLFNKNIYSIINKLYHQLTGKREDSVYIYGPDRVCVKPEGSTDMPRHIDCDLLSTDTRKDVTPSPPNYPNSYFRIQSIGCLQIDSKEKNNGRTEVLSGYHNYFRLGAKFFSQYLPPTASTQGRNFVPIVVQEVFAKHLDDFIAYVDSFYSSAQLLPFEETPLSEEEEFIYTSLPKNKVEIEWICPKVRAGDILCFDQRLPHRNTKNKSSISRVVCFISLYPGSYLDKHDMSPIDLFKGKVGKIRKYNSNDLEQDFFDEVWTERTSFELTPLVQQALGIKKTSAAVVKPRLSRKYSE